MSGRTKKRKENQIRAVAVHFMFLAISVQPYRARLLVCPYLHPCHNVFCCLHLIVSCDYIEWFCGLATPQALRLRTGWRRLVISRCIHSHLVFRLYGLLNRFLVLVTARSVRSLKLFRFVFLFNRIIVAWRSLSSLSVLSLFGNFRPAFCNSVLEILVCSLNTWHSRLFWLWTQDEQGWNNS